MREEVWAIVRAAVSEATQPLAAKNRELEERVLRAEQLAAQAAAAPRPQQASIPVLLGGSLAPPAAEPARKPRLSVPPGVYGVAVVDPGPQKPAVDTSNVAPFDMPDFGGKSRMAPKIIAGLMISIVVAVIVITILSHA